MLDPSGQPVPVGMIGEPLSVVRWLRAATAAGIKRLRNVSYVTRSRCCPKLASIGPATWFVSIRTVSWRSSAVTTSRSKCVGSVSSCLRSRPTCRPLRAWRRLRWLRDQTRAAGRVSSAMSSWPTVRCSTPPRCARTCSNTCPPSWCRRPGSSTRHCHSRQTARSIGARSFSTPRRNPASGQLETRHRRGVSNLAEIWQSVLGTMRVGHDDDFFALGGHFAARCAGGRPRANGLLVDLPLRAVFDHPTLAALAARSSICAAARSGREAPSSSAATVPFPRRSLLGNSVCGLSIC